MKPYIVSIKSSGKTEKEIFEEKEKSKECMINSIFVEYEVDNNVSYRVWIFAQMFKMIFGNKDYNIFVRKFEKKYNIKFKIKEI